MLACAELQTLPGGLVRVIHFLGLVGLDTDPQRGCRRRDAARCKDGGGCQADIGVLTCACLPLLLYAYMYLHLMMPGEGGPGRLQGSRLLAALCCCPEGVSEGTKVLRPAACQRLCSSPPL
jgi:hypothetical protein